MRARSIRVAVGVGVFVLMGEKAIEEAEENDCSSKLQLFSWVPRKMRECGWCAHTKYTLLHR